MNKLSISIFGHLSFVRSSRRSRLSRIPTAKRTGRNGPDYSGPCSVCLRCLSATLLVAIFLMGLPFSLSSALTAAADLLSRTGCLSLCTGFLFPVALGYAVLRQRVVDVQFAVSRTLVYGIVSTLALAFMAAVPWLLGRVIEQTHLTLGIEGLAAVGLGLVLHKATHGINLLVDRVLFSKHHHAEQRLRQVTAALPYATTERSIAETLVIEPVRNLNLSSAALFYRPGNEGPLRRVLAHGWTDDHLKRLDADALLVRYFQDEHAPLKLDDSALDAGRRSRRCGAAGAGDSNRQSARTERGRPLRRAYQCHAA